MTNSPKTYPKVIDKLQLYFGEPFQIDKLTIYQPTIGNIMRYGENDFYSMLSVFTGNTTTRRVALWEMGIDWCKITDFELFMSLVTGLTPDKTNILFGDLNFTLFKPYKVKELETDEKTQEQKEVERPILYDETTDITIDAGLYEYMALYLRTMFQSFPKKEIARDKDTKQSLIDEDKRKLKDARVLGHDPDASSLLPLISACLNHPGFKYKKAELVDVGIFEFMDAVGRLRIYESTTALLKGMYSGFVDTKGINKEEFDFMREIKADTGRSKPKKSKISGGKL